MVRIREQAGGRHHLHSGHRLVPLGRRRPHHCGHGQDAMAAAVAAPTAPAAAVATGVEREVEGIERVRGRRTVACMNVPMAPLRGGSPGLQRICQLHEPPLVPLVRPQHEGVWQRRRRRHRRHGEAGGAQAHLVAAHVRREGRPQIRSGRVPVRTVWRVVESLSTWMPGS